MTGSTECYEMCIMFMRDFLVQGEHWGEYPVPLGGENKGIPHGKITKCR